MNQGVRSLWSWKAVAGCIGIGLLCIALWIVWFLFSLDHALANEPTRVICKTCETPREFALFGVGEILSRPALSNSPRNMVGVADRTGCLIVYVDAKPEPFQLGLFELLDPPGLSSAKRLDVLADFLDENQRPIHEVHSVKNLRRIHERRVLQEQAEDYQN